MAYCAGMRAAALVSLLFIALTPRPASAQAPRGSVIIHPPQFLPKGSSLVVEVDAREVPHQAFNNPLAVIPGRKFVVSSLRDAQGNVVEDTHEQRVLVPPGGYMHIAIPQPEMGPDSGLIGGGITITTLGVVFLVGSGFLFSVADGAGSDCHTGGFAVDACGNSPAPFLGFGVTTLLFGIAGAIGGPVMIAEGAKPQVSWKMPSFNFGPGYASVGWRF